MPAAAVTAVGTVAVGVMQHRAANKAARAQTEASGQAYQYQASRDQLTDKRYNDAWADYQKRHAAWEQRNFGAQQGGGGGGGVTPVAATGQLPVQAMSQAHVTPQEGQSLADLGGWEDWKHYGVGGAA